MPNQFERYYKEHLSLVEQVGKDDGLRVKLNAAVSIVLETYKQGGKVLFCGNGGSAADSEHLAGELSGRFKIDRDPLHAEALHVNSAALTSIANDYGYSQAYARLLKSKAKAGDVLIALTTSGTSPNILEAIHAAQSTNVKVILMTGLINKDKTPPVDIHFIIPSNNTPRIQEAMMLLGHILCEEVEAQFFS